MKKQALAALILVGLIILLLVPVAAAQTPSPANTPVPGVSPVPSVTPVPGGGLTGTLPLDAKKLADTMALPEFRIVLLATIIFGGLGGLVYELMILQGNVEQPHKVKENAWVYDLGVWGRIIMGSLAAMIALLVISPEDAYKLVAISVVAGSSASAIFKSMQSRVEAMVAQQNLAQAQDTVAQISDKAEQLGQALGVGEGAPAGTRGVRGPAVPPSEAERKAAQLISEIKGLSASVRKPKA